MAWGVLTAMSADARLSGTRTRPHPGPTPTRPTHGPSRLVALPLLFLLLLTVQVQFGYPSDFFVRPGVLNLGTGPAWARVRPAVTFFWSH